MRPQRESSPGLLIAGLCAVTLLLAGVGTAVGTDTAPTGPASVPGCAGQEPHPPIIITEDEGPQGFVLENPVTGEPIYRPGSGVSAGDGSAEDPYVIEGLCITAHGFEPLRDGIVISDTSAHLVIQDSVVTPEVANSEPFLGSTVKGGSGIVVDGLAHLTVRDSTVAGHSGHGLDVTDVPGTTIENVTTEGNDGDGIALDGIGQVALQGAAVGDNAGYGIHLAAAGDTTILDTTITGHGDDGLRSEGSLDHLTVLDTNVSDNRGDGVDVAQATGLTFENTTVEDNGDDGIDIEDIPAPTIWNGTVTGNEASGIKLVNTPTATVKANTVQDNEGTHVWESGGIFLQDAPASLVEANTITGEASTGIRLVQSPDSSILYNVVSDAGYDGIGLNADNVQVRGNLVEGSVVGIRVASSTGVLVHGNTATDNQAYGIMVVSANTFLIRANNATNNGHNGIDLSNVEEGKMVANNIENNARDGLDIGSTADTFDVRGNWWGHETGPSGGAIDACTGEEADGLGQSIDQSGARVCFDPWLEAPNPDAGAS